MSSRERFEAWWVAKYEEHTYQHEDAHNMAWEGWQAARAEALEEARQACDERAAESRRMEAVCDSKERVWTDRDLQDEVTTEAAACAADIRALKDKEPA